MTAAARPLAATPRVRQRGQRLVGDRTIPFSDAWLAKRTDLQPGTHCWVWQMAKNNHGYPLTWAGGGKQCVHRAVWAFHHGPIGDDLCICHSCDNPSCVNPAHLWVGTRRANQQDMTAKGRHGRLKLTPDAVRAIRADQRGCRILAREFGVHRQTIQHIKQGVTWAHLA